jgi:hypothetical protein
VITKTRYVLEVCACLASFYYERFVHRLLLTVWAIVKPSDFRVANSWWLIGRAAHANSARPVVDLGTSELTAMQATLYRLKD